MNLCFNFSAFVSKDGGSEEIRAVDPNPFPDDCEECLLLVQRLGIRSLRAFVSAKVLKTQNATC